MEFKDELLCKPSFMFTPEDFIEEGVSLEEIEDSWKKFVEEEADKILPSNSTTCFYYYC